MAFFLVVLVTPQMCLCHSPYHMCFLPQSRFVGLNICTWSVSWFALCHCDKCRDLKPSWGRKRGPLAYRSQSILEGSQGRNPRWEQEWHWRLEDCSWLLVLLNMSCPSPVACVMPSVLASSLPSMLRCDGRERPSYWSLSHLVERPRGQKVQEETQTAQQGSRPWSILTLNI